MRRLRFRMEILSVRGYNATLDTYRDTMKHGKEWIAALQQQEREQTGISSLKISFNKVFWLLYRSDKIKSFKTR